MVILTFANSHGISALCGTVGDWEGNLLTSADEKCRDLSTPDICFQESHCLALLPNATQRREFNLAISKILLFG